LSIDNQLKERQNHDYSGLRPDKQALMEGTMNEMIDLIEKEHMRLDLIDAGVGDSVKVFTKIYEGDKERIQMFEGVVIGKRGGNTRATFTVRKVSYGVGVEKTFPKHSPLIEKIEVLSKAKVRRAKLYYLRNLKGKAAKLKEKRD
jgi:large subunit ribosomal protein L19